jgi:hypothetical protein
VREEAGSSRARLASAARRRGIDLPAGVTNGELAEVLAARLELDAGAWVTAADRASYGRDEEAEGALPALRGETSRLAKELRSGRRRASTLRL